MKRKKIALTALITFSVLTLFAFNSYAASGWYICTVNEAGPAGTKFTNIRLTDTADTPAFTNLLFRAELTRAKEQLAVALTAMASNLKVKVYTDPALSVSERILMMMYISPDY
jgi:hypothetical protein